MSNDSEEKRSLGQRFSDSANSLVDWLSNTLSRYRGLPMILALVLILLNFVLVFLDALVAGGIFLLAFPVQTNCLLHLGLIIGFIGILLAEPLGRG